MTTELETWIRTFARPASGGEAVRLLCFPHAGGSASFFAPAGAALAPDVQVFAVQYPGRQERRREPAARSVAELADRIATLLPEWIGEHDVAFLGHSFGAIVAFEVALRLGASGRRPIRLFASGRRAPSTHREERVHELDDAGLLRQLRRLSGTDPLLLADDELLQLILPAVRADYAAVEAYPPSQGTLDCPITVLSGRDDPLASRTETDAWSRHTTADIELREFPGGHFFISEHLDEVLALVRDRLMPVPSLTLPGIVRAERGGQPAIRPDLGRSGANSLGARAVPGSVPGFANRGAIPVSSIKVANGLRIASPVPVRTQVPEIAAKRTWDVTRARTPQELPREGL